MKELGYYICDNKFFDTKLKALLYANSKKLDVQWHFNDEIFNEYNWTIEPEYSLDYYYDQRARQIREEYDYVILSYSGGSDSNNILESFLRQNLFIDEIVTNWALDANSKYIVHDESVRDSWNNAAEFELHASKRLKYIKDKSPKTKINVIDTSKVILNGLLDNLNEDWFLTQNDVYNVTGAFQWNPLVSYEIRKTFDSLGKVAYILGVEKPKISIVDERMYIFFIDKATSLIPVRQNISSYTNVDPVFFYWSPKTCDLMCKQAHEIYKNFKINSKIRNLWKHGFFGGFFSKKNNNFFHVNQIKEIIMRDIIYSTTWNKEWFQVLKSVRDWGCELDDWFIKGMIGTKEHHIWFNGLKNLIPKIDNFMVHDDKHGIIGTKPFVSKSHYIGNFYD